MSITRSRLKFDDQYTQVPNAWVRDGRLSLKARGLLVQLLSHRVGWRVSVASLVAANPEGRDAIRSALVELESCGYLTRAQAQDEQTGQFEGIEYALADPWADYPATDNPSTVPPAETVHNGRSEPVSGFPSAVSPAETGHNRRSRPVSGYPTSGNPHPKKNISKEDHREDHQNTVGDSADATPTAREDVAEVCRIVADHVETVTGTRPTVGKRWETQARLMLDRDGRTVEQIRAIMGWVGASAFWSPNILSVPKLREKWPTLVGQARRDATGGTGSWVERERAAARRFAGGAS